MSAQLIAGFWKNIRRRCDLKFFGSKYASTQQPVQAKIEFVIAADIFAELGMRTQNATAKARVTGLR